MALEFVVPRKTKVDYNYVFVALIDYWAQVNKKIFKVREMCSL